MEINTEYGGISWSLTFDFNGEQCCGVSTICDVFHEFWNGKLEMDVDPRWNDNLKGWSILRRSGVPHMARQLAEYLKGQLYDTSIIVSHVVSDTEEINSYDDAGVPTDFNLCTLLKRVGRAKNGISVRSACKRVNGNTGNTVEVLVITRTK